MSRWINTTFTSVYYENTYTKLIVEKIVFDDNCRATAQGFGKISLKNEFYFRTIFGIANLMSVRMSVEGNFISNHKSTTTGKNNVIC